ncbi:MAG: DUF1016 domain-containing protein, partial [Candidatus Hydrogenedentes bacterium]|nr:DUF1016 domain-containing protein [Candidatus Hydrogenedentota bacterium]
MNKKITGQKNLRINKEQEDYHRFYTGVEDVLEYARHMVVSTANAIMTATYWEIGRRIVEFEQEGKARATYGAEVIKRLSGDLKGRFGRGFGVDNLQRFRTFYLAYPQDKIYATLSRISDEEGGKGKYATVSRISALVNHQDLKEVIPLEMAAQFFPLPWSAYVRLLSVKNEQARCFYETEALRGGWSVRQLNRQIESQFYERTALSKNKAAM